MTLEEQEIRNIWRTTQAVCFDVDSTVCRDEAIDELAKFAGKEKEVADLTAEAMGGNMSFNVALAKRLEIIRPSVSMINSFLQKHPPRLTPGIRELVAALHSRKVDVYLVSGGFDSLIEPVAKELDIPSTNIFANRIKFYLDGSYAGFDESQPTCRQNGKSQVITFLKDRFSYEKIVMIGDGVTDLIASPPADAFIGFGGNQIREKVAKGSKWFVTSFYDLLSELNK